MNTTPTLSGKALLRVRRQNFMALLTQFLEDPKQSQATFAKASGVVKPYVSQLKDPSSKRNLGEAVARRMEQRLGLTYGWMDVAHKKGEHIAIKPQPPKVAAPFEENQAQKSIEDALVGQVLTALYAKNVNPDDVLLGERVNSPFGFFRVGVYVERPKRAAVDIVRLSVTSMDTMIDWLLAQATRIKEAKGPIRYAVVFYEEVDRTRNVKFKAFVPQLTGFCDGAVKKGYINAYCMNKGAGGIHNVHVCVEQLLR